MHDTIVANLAERVASQADLVEPGRRRRPDAKPDVPRNRSLGLHPWRIVGNTERHVKAIGARCKAGRRRCSNWSATRSPSSSRRSSGSSKPTPLYDSETNEPPRIHFDRHLYQPLLIEKASDGPPSKLKTTPPQLHASETRFVEDLRAYWKDRTARNQTDARQILLLRNLSRGAGVGFLFEDRDFYPDFILSIKDGSTQKVVFIKPHGMMHARAYDKDKARLHEALRELTLMLQPPPGVSRVSLDSFIVSATPYQDLHPRYGDEAWTREQFAQSHILFQEHRGTSGYDYIAAIFGSGAS